MFMEVAKIIVCILISVGTFLLWEGVAWFTHKYVMHGILWSWHKSHHTVHHHKLEKNDLFAVVFSLPSIGLFYYATQVSFNPYLLAVAVGIFAYGVFYFVFHDIIVHQRIKWRPSTRPQYLQRMIHAHYIHHSKHTRDGCEAFGFLYAPPKYAPKKFSMRAERSQTQ
jgi:beta-carotene 3-hydroxylase